MQINTLIIQINDSTKTSTKFSRATLPFGLIALMVVIVAATPVITFAQQAQNATQNTTQGFGGPPSGPLTAIRHVFDDPILRVWHFCKPNDKIMMVCQLYDSNSPTATLIGVEYMITTDAYKNLPERKAKLALS
jgi:hypothetical protein